MWAGPAWRSELSQEGLDSHLLLLVLRHALAPSPPEFVVHLTQHAMRGGNGDAGLCQPQIKHRLVDIGFPERRIGVGAEAALGVISNQRHVGRKLG
jgi:hypothetical protein